MKLLVTGAFNCTSDRLDLIEQMGHKVIYMQNESEGLPCVPTEIDGVICNGLFLHHSIEEFTSLKYIQLTSAGYDRVPMDYVNAKGIEIHNAKGVYSVPMAEFAVSGVLQLYKQSKYFYENQKNHNFQKHRGLMELAGKTVCIIGCGNVGAECAVRFNAFGCRVVGVDIVPYESEIFEKIYPIETLDDVLSQCDVVVLTLPLTDETKHLFNESRFAHFKNGAVLVNIARGAVVKTDDLVKALNVNLSGAVLDVFENEPLNEDSELWDMENVIITPHNSFVGENNDDRLFKVVFENLRRKING